jgi:hypothetical protein
MNRLVLLLSLFISVALNAQNEFSGYNWNTFPKTSVSDTVKSVNGSLITLERRINEIYLNKENVFEELTIFHRKIKVETNDAINSFNKIYIPLTNVIEVVGVEARFISPSGKITDVPQESIREVENLENKGNFKILAIEGAETGGEIEYYYKLRKKLNPYGSLTIQNDDTKTNVEIIFAYPAALEFYFKSYNGFPDFVASSDTSTKTNYLKASIPYISAIPEERYAAYDANLMRYEFTLTHNNYSSVLRIYSFSKAGNNVYTNLYETTKAEKSVVKTALKGLQISSFPVMEQVRRIENWLKSELVISEDLAGTPSIDQMLKMKQTTKYGMMRLMVAFFNQLNVKFETVLACKVTERKFDPEFNGWNYLNDYLIYFPEVNQVILPENPSYRIGLMPSIYEDSYALFLHPITYGEDLNTLAYDIKKLPKENYKNNTDSLIIKIKMNMDHMNMEADIHRVFTGELASSFQSVWQLINTEKQDELVSSMFNMGTQNTTIRSYNLKNYYPSDIGYRPLLWDVKLTANALIEQAGDDILVKIGETIGEQAELYQETNRKLPVYVGSLHSYFRKIEFDIPEGYTASNLEDLKMKVEMIRNNKVSCCFTSDYELSGNKLIVYSTEYYSELEYPVGEFEAFRNVINAAADFNKKTILLTRK